MATESDPADSYLQLVKDHLYQLDDELLVEDIDLLCQYIVLRFLKTSPEVHTGESPEDIKESLDHFIGDIYPFLVTFVTMVNSSPLAARGGHA